LKAFEKTVVESQVSGERKLMIVAKDRRELIRYLGQKFSL